MPAEIEQALAAVRGGDVNAFALAVRAHDDDLSAFLARRCPDAHTLEEVWHDAFVCAFGRIARYDPRRAPFGGWLKGIARNLLRRRLRELARTRAVDAALVDDADAPERPADERQLAALRRCLAKLPDERAALVRARYAEARPVADVAAALGRTVTWVTTTLQRVRRALRDCVEASLREGP